MVLSCGEGVKITIPEISKMQKGVNFIYKNTVGELDSDKKTTVYSLNFFGKQPIQSDFVIEWKLGVNAYELRESFKIKVEEEDIITYYILKDGKYFDEFTVDYMTDDISEDIVLVLENEGGTTLGNYSITTKRPLHVAIRVVDGVLEIENPKYPKLDVEPSTGIGLENLRSRWQIVTGCDIEIIDEEQRFGVTHKETQNPNTLYIVLVYYT